MKYYHDVKSFHDKFGLVTPPNFVLFPRDLHEFRVKFFEEELKEYVESFETRDLAMVIDALIDLVYITCGTALLHGFGEEIFESSLTDIYFFESRELLISTPPAFLTLDEHHRLKQNLLNAISDYRVAYNQADVDSIARSLNSLYWNCLEGAATMRFNEARWNLLWDDVQRANMSKERAVRADQSKRGSTYDVFKPAGWIAPRSEELVEKMISGEA